MAPLKLPPLVTWLMPAPVNAVPALKLLLPSYCTVPTWTSRVPELLKLKGLVRPIMVTSEPPDLRRVPVLTRLGAAPAVYWKSASVWMSNRLLLVSRPPLLRIRLPVPVQVIVPALMSLPPSRFFAAVSLIASVLPLATVTPPAPPTEIAPPVQVLAAPLIVTAPLPVSVPPAMSNKPFSINGPAALKVPEDSVRLPASADVVPASFSVNVPPLIAR